MAGMFTPESIANALGGAIKNGDDSWNAVCPAHDDVGPSLTISESKQGRLLVHCHGGCTQEAVIKALDAKGLWPKRAVKSEPLPHAPKGTDWPDSAAHPRYGEPFRSWQYFTADGDPVGLVHRWNLGVKEDGRTDKTFASQTWGVYDSGKAGWVWKTFAKPRPLYRLQLLKGETRPILLVEGEKTADAAISIMGEWFPMTMPGGSKAAKYTDFTPLKGRDVTIWPDSDEVGVTGANRVAEILLALPARSVRVIKLPEDLPKHWDLADALPDGWDYDKLRKIAHDAGDYVASGDKFIDEINESYATITVGDSPAILNEYVDDKGNPRFRYLKQSAFSQRYCNRMIADGREDVPLDRYWLRHEERRTYESIVFLPSSKPASKSLVLPRSTTHVPYNIWQGFSFEPDEQGDWSLLDAHIRDNIAQGNEEHYRWVLGWFAQMIQHPERKLGTSLAFRGSEGVGKTIMGKHFGALIKPHYVLVTDVRHLLGNFNAHKAACILMHADEAFWAADPRQIGELKDLVTGDTTRLEFKGKDVIFVDSFIRLLVTSDKEWIIPASFNDRRFAVWDISDAHKQDHAYFKGIEDQLQNGGYAGLLHSMLNFDLSTVDLLKLPDTQARQDQKQLSLTPIMRFLKEALDAGELIPGSGEWETKEPIPTESIYQAYVTRSKLWNERWVMSREHMVAKLKQMLEPAGELIHRQTWSEVRDPISFLVSRKRVWGYLMPHLEASRQAFANAMAGEPHKVIEIAELEAPVETTDDDTEIPF